MWKIAYNLALSIILPFFIVFSLTKRKIRKNLAERLFSSTKHASVRDAIWIHAASIGEAVIAETLVDYLRKYYHQDNFLLTTNTYYTQDLLKKKFGDSIKIYPLPFDLAYSIRHFIDGSTFKALIIIETELWPNLIWEVKKKGTPIIIINGRISDTTFKSYMRFTFFFKTVFPLVDLVLSQSDEHAKRFISIGMNPGKVINTGNLKYYRNILYGADDMKLKDNRITFGSIKEKEINILLPVIARLKKTFPDFMIFVAPRELALVDIIEKELSMFLNAMRYSKFKNADSKLTDAVVVDTVGDLLDIYRKSKVAFVGGSLAPYGGQNILEPLFFGTPVIFGPYIDNFKDIANMIIEQGAGATISNGDALYERIKTILEDEVLRNKMGHKGRKIIEMQREVVEKTVNRMLDTIGINHI